MGRTDSLTRFAVPVADAAATASNTIECRHQEQDNWCWAACLQMILSLTNPREQSDIVNAALQRSDCQLRPASNDCDVRIPIAGPAPSVIEAIARVQLRGTFVNDALLAGELCQRLDDAPVIAGFNASGSGGHVVLVVAWDDGVTPDNPRVLVNDPGSGPPHGSWRTYNELFDGLGLSFGQWSSTIHSIA